MKQKLIIVLFMFFNGAFSQSSVDSLMQLGNTYYRKQDFINAGKTWENASKKTENKLAQSTNYYYTSSAYAAAQDSVNSFRCLDIAVTQLGFNDLPALKNDPNFTFMHHNIRWIKLLSTIVPVYTTDPNAVKVVDLDVINFWKAHDMVLENPKMAEKIYLEKYINIGTMALQFYFLNKINTVQNFAYMHDIKKKYYASIRENTFKAAQFKSAYQASFVNLKNIYPEAIFPPIYFVIGKLNSGGTVSSEGLILAIDQACMSPNTDTSELNNWEKHNISAFEDLPHTVGHEIIHFEQDGMASDTTLLAASIKEGMADFIGELISGKSANERLLIFAKGKEKAIWEDFRKEMFLDRAYNWIANSEQETAEKPADLGYWVGYQICKAYYYESTDKNKAIYEMLHIQDYKKFLEESKFERKFSQ